MFCWPLLLLAFVPSTNGIGEMANGTEPVAMEAAKTDLLDGMLAKDKEVVKALGKEADKEQAQKVGSHSDAEMLFLAADNPEKAEPEPYIAWDWVDGQRLTDKQAKDKALVTMEEEGVLKYQATVPGPTIPVRLHFEGGNCAKDSKNPHFFHLKICLGNGGKECKEGTSLCFPGKMDPKNNGNLDRIFQLANKKDPQNCGKQEAWKIWDGKTLHEVRIKTVEGGKLEISASFSNHTVLLDPKDGCVVLSMGSESEMFGSFADANKDHGEEEAKQELANGCLFADLPLAQILALDLLMNFNESEPLFAFNAGKDCDLVMQIEGERLKSCADQNCTKPAIKIRSASDQKKALYKNEVGMLKPVLSLADLPPIYRDFIQIGMKEVNGKKGTRAVIRNKGEEVIFALATKDLSPPELVFLRPDNAQYCTGRGEFQQNELVLAYNARPDCFGRFAWGERAVFFRDDMEETTRIVTMKHMPLIFQGDNEDEIWTVNQYGEPQILGRGTCPIEAVEIKTPFQGMDGYHYLWTFIMNPGKGENTPRAQRSRCDLGFIVDVEQYSLLVPSAQKNEEGSN